jgi:hypothetical protein
LSRLVGIREESGPSWSRRVGIVVVDIVSLRNPAREFVGQLAGNHGLTDQCREHPTADQRWPNLNPHQSVLTSGHSQGHVHFQNSSRRERPAQENGPADFIGLPNW